MSAVFRYCPRCAAPMTDAERDEALRRVCSDPDCGYIHWNLSLIHI